MPAVLIPIVSYAITSVGLEIGSLTLLTYSTAIATALVYGGLIAASVAYSSSQSAKARRALHDAMAQGRTYMLRDPLAYRRCVYGKVRLSGVMTFAATSGTKNEYLHMVVVFAGHQIESFDAIYADGNLLTLDGSGNDTGTYAGFLNVQTHLGAPGQVADANLVAAGVGVDSTFVGNGIAYLYVKATWDSTKFPSGIPNITADVRGKLVYDPRDGTQSSSNPSTWKYSNNAALCIADFLNDSYFGRGIPWARIDSTDLIASANTCDEIVTLGANVQRLFDTISGNTFLKLSDQTSYDALNYIASGDAVSGAAIPSGATVTSLVYSAPYGINISLAATTTTSKTTVDITSAAGEPRYTVNGALDTSMDIDMLTSDLASAMGGCVSDTGGIWHIKAGAWTSPVVTLSDDDMLSPLAVQTRQSRKDNFNAIRGTFYGPDNMWQGGDFPPYSNATFAAQDGGLTLWKDVRYMWTTSSWACQRLSKLDVARSRNQITVKGTWGLRALQLVPGDIVSITRATLGWSAKTFEVITWEIELTPSKDQPIGVTMTLLEASSSVFSWANGDATSLPWSPATNLPNPRNVTAPTSLTATSSSTVLSDGTVSTYANVSWAQAANQFVISGGSVRLQYKAHGSANWLEWSVQNGAMTGDSIPISPGYWDFQVRFENNLGAVSAWTQLLNVYLVISLPAPAVPSGVTATVGTGKAVELNWTANTEANLAGYKVYRYTSNTPASAVLIADVTATKIIDTQVTLGAAYWYWVTAYNTLNSETAKGTGVTATPSWVLASSTDATPPSNPTAPTLNASGAYVTGSGTVLSYFDFNVSALPILATSQNLLYRQTGSSQWILANPLTNTSATVARIPDLSPNVQYDVAIEAVSAFDVPSAIITATGSPFTAPMKTAAPGSPTSLAVYSPSSSAPVPPKYLGGSSGVQLFGCTLKWTAPTNAPDVVGYEWVISTSNSVAPTSGYVSVPAMPTQMFLYTANLIGQYVWLRSVDSSGNRSTAVVCATNLNTVVSLSAGNMSQQNSSSVSMTGVQVGSGPSVTQIVTEYAAQTIYTTTGGAPTETVSIDLTNRGFSTKPDVGNVTFSSPHNNVGAYYDWTNSTSTTAKVVLFTLDGTNFGASWAYGLSCRFTQHA